MCLFGGVLNINHIPVHTSYINTNIGLNSKNMAQLFYTLIENNGTGEVPI